MVFLAGDNNLSAECVYALTEMKRANLSDRINIIAQFDPQTSIFQVAATRSPTMPPPASFSSTIWAAPLFRKVSAPSFAPKRAEAVEEFGKIIKAPGGKAAGRVSKKPWRAVSNSNS